MNNGANNVFSVLPMSQRFSLSAGETYRGSISVVNPATATSDFAFMVEVVPYNVLDDEYTTDFTNILPHSRIAEWITVDEPTGVLKPNEVREVNFTIEVPEDAPGGGQYAALMVSLDLEASKAAEGGITINNIYELASVIYADVTGETIHRGEILENNIPGFALKTPVDISALIKNEGNTHEDATFELKVTNEMTGEVIYPVEGDSGQYTELVMPGVSRYIVRGVENLPELGVVKISQTVYFGQDASFNEQTVIICPLWFILLVTLTLVSLVTLIVAWVKLAKRKKRRLIQQAQ